MEIDEIKLRHKLANLVCLTCFRNCEKTQEEKNNCATIKTCVNNFMQEIYVSNEAVECQRCLNEMDIIKEFHYEKELIRIYYCKECRICVAKNLTKNIFIND